MAKVLYHLYELNKPEERNSSTPKYKLAKNTARIHGVSALKGYKLIKDDHDQKEVDSDHDQEEILRLEGEHTGRLWRVRLTLRRAVLALGRRRGRACRRNRHMSRRLGPLGRLGGVQ